VINIMWLRSRVGRRGRGKNASATFEFLKQLRFKYARPTPLYYYRALQNLRDPLHFREP